MNPFVHTNLRTRLLLIVFVGTLMIGGGTMLFIVNLAVQNQTDDSQREIIQLMDAVEASAAVASYSNNNEIAQEVIKGLLRSDDICHASLRNDGGLNVQVGKDADIAVCTQVLTRILHSPFDDQEVIGRIETRVDGAAIKAHAYRQAGQLALSLLALMLLPTIVIWLGIARFITKPIHKVSEQLHRVAIGTSQRVTVTGDASVDEIALLTQDVNVLLDTVERTLQEEREQRVSVEELKRKYQQLAHHDSLTGLPNRALFTDRVQQALVQAKRDATCSALMFLDLDKFKPVNDNLGHDIGDVLLKQVAQRIQLAVRESDTVARIGGDEFVVLLPLIETPQDAQTVAEKIRFALNQPFQIETHSINISSSIGIALYPAHGEGYAELVKCGDMAMYQAKKEGRNNAQMFRPGMQMDAQ